MNQEQWFEGTLLEVDEQVITTPQVNTPVTQSTQHKRAREKNQSATETVKEYYIIQKKLSTRLSMSSGSKPLEIIDIGYLEDVSSAGTTDPKPPSSS